MKYGFAATAVRFCAAIAALKTTDFAPIALDGWISSADPFKESHFNDVSFYIAFKEINILL